MEKRTLLAIVLSSLVLLSWSLWVSKTYHIDNKEVTGKIAQPIAPVSIPPAPKQEAASSLPTFKLDLEKISLTFIEPWAAIKEIIFTRYKDYHFPLQYGLLLGNRDWVFQQESRSENSVRFVYEDNQKRILKVFNFSNSNYNIELSIETQNLSNQIIKVNLPLILGVLDFNRDPMQARFQDVTIALKDKIMHLNGRKELFFDGVKFLALRDRYFCAIIQPESNNWQAGVRKINAGESEIYLSQKEIILSPGQKVAQIFHIYFGPQELKQITSVNAEWQGVAYYGSFNFIAHLLLRLLDFLYQLIHNWGWVIIGLSLLIYFLLFPLTLKQMHSMKHMQALQPAIEELRKKYKDNPQKLNREIMELYRLNKVNPFAGCLPLILQIPVFFALYQVLIRSVALKGANFLWIKDLSEPDRLFTLPISLPILGNEINLLPILMTIGMFMQQKISLTATSGEAAEQQKLMLIIMPLMFGFIFYHMPAGLVLYWFVNSSLMLIYQFRIHQ